MEKDKKDEKICWIQLYGFLTGLAVLCYIPAVVELTSALCWAICIVAGILAVAIYTCADRINAIHGKRQLMKYRKTLEGHENDIQYLKMKLADVEKRLVGMKLARGYNMAKRELLTDMIKKHGT